MDGEERLAVADEQIETLLAAIWPAAEQGKPSAIDVARRLIELQTRLHGLQQSKPAAHDERDDELASYRRRHTEPGAAV